MLFNTLQFIVFFIVVPICYFKLSHSYRWMLLLLASCYFYNVASQNGVSLLAATFFTVFRYIATFRDIPTLRSVRHVAWGLPWWIISKHPVFQNPSPSSGNAGIFPCLRGLKIICTINTKSTFSFIFLFTLLVSGIFVFGVFNQNQFNYFQF